MISELERKRRRRRAELACRILGRRLVALVLCLGMFLSLLPLTVPLAAASETTPQDQSGQSGGAIGSTLTIAPSSETPATAGTPMTNTYMLEVSTGSVRGGGTADNVKYFVIYYTTGAGGSEKTRSAVIFPGKDAMRKSMNAASAVGTRNERRQLVEDFFGYTTATLQDRKGLGNVHTDQLLFTTPEPVKTIDRIQIFGRMEETTGADGSPKIAPSSWQCQGMRISRVDTLYGLEMYGWYSDDGYIDYKGEIIADVVMAKGGGNFRWNSSAGVFNITGPGSGNSAAGVTLVNTETAQSYGKANFVGTRHDSQVTNRVVFEIALADVLDGGFECLAGSYEAGAQSKISSLKLCEAASLRFYYRDVYGCIRQVCAPVIVDALGWTVEKYGGRSEGNLALAGYAQQGDTIALSLMLPDFQELTSVEEPNGSSVGLELSIGETKAREKTNLKTASGADQEIRPYRVAGANQEVVSYVCIAAYRDVTVSIGYNGATLRYSLTPGAQEPGAAIVAGSVEGVDLDAGTTNILPMINYRENMKLRPGDSRKYYLITITTDNVSNAGTAKEIYLQFRYLSMRDKEVTSNELRVQNYVKQFYGEWPGNADNFAYNYGLRTGGTVYMIIPMNDVKQFRSVSVKVDGPDEWQFKGIRVQELTSYSTRDIRWQEIDEPWTTSQNLKSHVIISRNFTAKSPCFECGVIYEDPDSAPDPTDPNSGWTPGNLIQDDGKYHEFDGSSTEISDEEPFDWTDYRYYMTYEDTLRDLGFTKQRCLYTVTVQVAGDKVNAANDDCGSANLFYFQLIFEDGKSGCVLANQQLQADAFRTGAEARFDIPTTQDYGDLTAIRIIPDDQDSNSDIYDKLKIQYIKVKKQSTGQISPTWTADSDSQDGLGWVGIDYRDPGAAGSTRGTEGRSISEIAHTFEITKTSYSTKLLIAISTGSYNANPATNAYGETFMVQDPILEGGMSMSVDYYDHNGGTLSVDPVDIVKLMNDYAGLENKYTRTVDGVTETMDFCVSDPDYQFRPGTTDKFYFDVDDISQLSKMQLKVRSNVSTHWTIDNVAVYLVQGPGSRYINGNGEYDYKYPEGQGLNLRCTWNRPQSLTKDIETFKPPKPDDPESAIIGTSIVTIDIGFNENEFPISDQTWTSKVTREPSSKNDTLNLLLYPSTDSAATDPSNYNLSAEVLYTDTINQSALRIGTGNMNYAEDSSGRPVFYALGLSANYFEALAGVEVKANSIRPVHVPISYGVLQRVRDGVLIDSYYLMGGGNADLGLTMHAFNNPAGQTIQRVFLQTDHDTPYQELVTDENDLAVAIYFTTDGPNDSELRTKYIYLTDQGYSYIQSDQVLELDFCIDNLEQIYGINLVCMGRLDVGLENVEILQQNANGTINGKWSFRNQITPTRTPARFNPYGLVTLLDLDLTTALSDATVNSGTDGPIRMTVGYLDQTNNLRTETYDDIRYYLDTTHGFQAGDTNHIRLLVPDLSELRWVELEPLSETVSIVSATWKLQDLAAMLDLSGLTVSRVVDQLIVEGTPLRISLADILLAGTVSIVTSPADRGNVAGDYVIPTNGTLDLMLNIGEGVRVAPVIQGSKEGVEVTLNRIDPATGALGNADLVDTRGYTQEVLDAYAAAAEAKGNHEEAALWRSIIPDEGTWEVTESYDPLSETASTDSILFIPPHNYTSATITYRITLTSRENGAAVACVNLSVPTEINPIEALLAEAQANDQTNHEHNIVFTAPVEPTCIHEGHTAYYSCSGCGKYFEDALGETEIPDLEATVIPALGHSWGDWTYSDDTASQGHYRICTVCGEKDSLSDHSFTDTVIPPTEDDQGYTHHECSACGYAYDGDYVKPLGHDYVVHFSVPDGIDGPSDMVSNTNSGISMPWVEAPQGYAFEGWTTTPNYQGSTAPDSLYKYGWRFVATKEITWYAVFSSGLEADVFTGQQGNLPDGRYLITKGELDDYFLVLKGIGDDSTYTNNHTEDWEVAGMTLNGTHLSGIKEDYVFDISQLPGETLYDSYQLYTIYNEGTRTYLSKTNGLRAVSAYSPDTCKWAISLNGYAQVFYNNPLRYLNWDSGKWCVTNWDPDDLYFWKVTGQIAYTTIID